MEPETLVGDNDVGVILTLMAGTVVSKIVAVGKTGSGKTTMKLAMNSMYGKPMSEVLPVEPSHQTQPVGQEMVDLFPGLDSPTTCPASTPEGPTICMGGASSVLNLIVHLNDYHEWSREQIADWLDGLDVDLTLAPIQKGN